MRRARDVLTDVENGLLAEQGEICAYTGLRIAIRSANDAPETTRDVDFHIEHLRPQVHCSDGKDTEYSNIVACWPRPNCGFEPAFGARKKQSWPSPQEETLFVSPLRDDCSARFTFNYRGEIAATYSNDQAAVETISRLGLDHDTLKELRKKAILGAFHPRGRPIRLKEALRLRSQLDKDSQALDRYLNVQLKPFCFVIRQALEHEIRKLEGIMGLR
ncbi:MAG: TIGR02646 family protein [Syntrophobacteraceae bacterium]